MSKSFYITTAIDYANGRPHLGHAYEKVLTDCIARHRRLRGDTVHFLTGLDEHGQKVQATARNAGKSPQQMVDEVAIDFQNLCSELLISNTDFIRTTQPRHRFIVRELLQAIHDKGEIYRAEYSGFYSPRQEQFLQEKDKVEGKWPEIFGEVIEITESNYFFKLSQYQDWLIGFLEANPNWIVPAFRQKQVLEFLREPLNDLCISRPRDRLEWGIPLPFDEDYVTYVWFDALTNYTSAVGCGPNEHGEIWPADFHVIGKDILVPPHAVYWPIMLHAAGIPLPHHILVHGWWHLDGQKMSKTLGNIVDPFNLIDTFGADAVRYFFMREMVLGQDSSFTEDLFFQRYKALGDDFGNSLARLLNMAARYTGGKVPQVEERMDGPEATLRNQWEESSGAVLAAFDELQFHKGLDFTWGFLRELNRYLDTREPWKKAKSTDFDELALVQVALAYLAESLRLAATLLIPVMPRITETVFERLGMPIPETYTGQLQWDVGRLAGNQLGEKVILFPRVERG